MRATANRVVAVVKRPERAAGPWICRERGEIVAPTATISGQVQASHASGFLLNPPHDADVQVLDLFAGLILEGSVGRSRP